MTNIFSDNQSEFIKLPFLSDSKIAGIIELLKGIALIVVPLLFLYKWFKGKHKKKFRTVKEIQKYINDNLFIDNMIKLISAFITIILAIKLIFFYVPNNSQLSLALLISYLKHEKIINKNFYKLIKNFRPENIGNYIDPQKFKITLDQELGKVETSSETITDTSDA